MTLFYTSRQNFSLSASSNQLTTKLARKSHPLRPLCISQPRSFWGNRTWKWKGLGYRTWDGLGIGYERESAWRIYSDGDLCGYGWIFSVERIVRDFISLRFIWRSSHSVLAYRNRAPISFGSAQRSLCRLLDPQTNVSHEPYLFVPFDIRLSLQSTRKAYSSSVKAYSTFLLRHNTQAFPVQIKHLTAWIAHLAPSVTQETIRNYIKALRHYHVEHNLDTKVFDHSYVDHHLWW